ncbi:MAG: hypothetical protein HYX69_21620 [Planctomycetia bacterium]|nr:hypothetical protein [Planctomycetia bacterium]
MVKHLVSVGTLLALLSAAVVAQADIVAVPFSDPGYVAGNPLSAFFWETNKVSGKTIDTSRVLDLEDVGGEHGNVVKLTANGPDPGPGFPSIAAQAGDSPGGGWGGPNRGDAQDLPLYFAVDIQKGVGDANTPSSSFIWSLSTNRGNGANILTLDGGLGTFRLKTENATNNTVAFTLGQGWNQIVVRNDLSANPNTVLYLNGVPIASLDAGGPLASATTAFSSVRLTRQGRGGTGDHFVGTMRFDNVITANEDIIRFLSGDVSHDGIVDVSDIQTIAANYLTAGPTGDANNDGIVDISDIQVVAANYLNGGGGIPAGNGGGAGASLVPEPTGAVLMAVGLALCTVSMRRRIAK